MINFQVLEKFGTTNARLREFFTAEAFSTRKLASMKAKLQPKEFNAAVKANEKDVALRQKMEDQVNSWLEEHILFSLKNHHRYAAIDLAWDSCPINKRIMPLMMYAQGRINVADAVKSLEALPEGSTYIKKDAAGQQTIDLPKFTEVNINLIRSVITRRVASQAVKYDSLWPFFKYEARSNTQIGKLCADLTSQRMDIMADQYGYRHFQTQVTRDMFLYTNSVAFPRASWERDVQIDIDRSKATEMTTGADLPVKTTVVREGLAWVNPHPSRIFYDNAHPISSLNTDTGCEYAGFWDVCRWGDIKDNLSYFNRKSVSFSADTAAWFQSYNSYFSQYYDKVSFPNLPADATDPSQNDRKNNIGIYTGDMANTSCFFTHIWRKIIPQEWGIGTYPHPVWIHLKVAGDATVVYADICPSSPAAVFAYNANDGKMENISVAEELMPFQDQLTNLFSQLLEIAKADLFSVAVLNTDVFPDTADGKKVLEEFRRAMTGKNFYAQTQILEASFAKLAQLNIDASKVFTVIRSHPNTAITNVFNAIVQVLSMADRLMVMSQHEQGQTAPHEISATESNQLAGSTETVYAFISNALDEGRAAMKRVCFESLIAKGSDEVTLTAAARYPKNVIEKAGFKVIDNDLDDPMGYFTLMGKTHSLNHDYIFTTRDGGDRAANNQGAQVLVQLLQSMFAAPPEVLTELINHIGKEKLFEIFNSIFRMADAGVDLKLEIKPGEDDAFGLASSEQQVMGAIQQIAQQLKVTASQVQQLMQMAGMQPAQPPPQPEPPQPQAVAA